MSIENHVLYALANANVKKWPFSHFYAENVFPDNFYETLLDVLDRKTEFSEQAFKNRTFAETHNLSKLDFMLTRSFKQRIFDLFDQPEQLNARSETRLIRDHEGYKIGPHTDSPHKIVSLLFYLPATDDYADFGTSVYVPNDPSFKCAGGPHYPFEPFDKVTTAPYRANSCFGFWKTDRSFHGVEPLTVEFNRDILLYNIYNDAR